LGWIELHNLWSCPRDGNALAGLLPLGQSLITWSRHPSQALPLAISLSLRGRPTARLQPSCFTFLGHDKTSMRSRDEGLRPDSQRVQSLLQDMSKQANSEATLTRSALAMIFGPRRRPASNGSRGIRSSPDYDTRLYIPREAGITPHVPSRSISCLLTPRLHRISWPVPVDAAHAHRHEHDRHRLWPSTGPGL